MGITAINLTTAAGHHFFASTRRITGGYRFFVEDVTTNSSQALNVMINDYAGTARRPSPSDRS